PLDPVDAAGGHVEEDVDEVVRQEVDLVDIEDAAVGSCEQAGLEAAPALGERPFDVEGADQTILGCTHRELDERRLAGKQGGQASGQGRLGAPLLPPQQHTADGRVECVQEQRQLGVV